MRVMSGLIITVLSLAALADGLPGAYFNSDFFAYQFGTRQDGMAGSGISYPNDENALQMNPAGLGIENKLFKRAALSFSGSWAPRLDFSFVIHKYYNTFCIQPTIKDIGGFGFLIDVNALTSSEEIMQTQWENGQIISTGKKLKDNHYFTTIKAGYGKNLSFINFPNHSLGFSLALGRVFEDNFGAPVHKTSLSFDFGYAGIFLNKLSLGLSVLNVPIVKSFENFGEEDVDKSTRLFIAVGLLHKKGMHKEKDILSLFAEVNNKLGIYKYKAGGWNNQPQNIEYDISQSISLGFEMGLFELFYIRNGC